MKTCGIDRKSSNMRPQIHYRMWGAVAVVVRQLLLLPQSELPPVLRKTLVANGVDIDDKSRGKGSSKLCRRVRNILDRVPMRL